MVSQKQKANDQKTKLKKALAQIDESKQSFLQLILTILISSHLSVQIKQEK